MRDTEVILKRDDDHYVKIHKRQMDAESEGKKAQGEEAQGEKNVGEDDENENDE